MTSAMHVRNETLIENTKPPLTAVRDFVLGHELRALAVAALVVFPLATTVVHSALVPIPPIEGTDSV